MSTVGETTTEETTAAAPRDRRRSLTVDLIALIVIGILLLVSIAAGGVMLYRALYSPSAFVERYAHLLADGQAAAALALPGVAVDSAELEAAGLPSSASEALLRSSALGSLTDIRAISEETIDGVVEVTLAYSAAGHSATTVFTLEQDGMIGIAPRWEFVQSPIAVMSLTVDGSTSFAVNGFEVDKRQVSPDGAAADLSAAIPLLVFSPGLYAVTVDTLTATSTGVAMLSDVPFANVPVTVTATATDAFVTLVQDKVDAFLDECTTQQVLQPTACPFGFPITDRIVTLPTWSMVSDPAISLVADGAGWRIEQTEAVAHIQVSVRSLFDGSVTDVDVDVPFEMTGAIDILPDGTASIVISAADPQ